MGGEIVSIVAFLGVCATIGAFIWAVRERRDRIARERAEALDREARSAREMAADIERNKTARRATPKLPTFTEAQARREIGRRHGKQSSHHRDLGMHRSSDEPSPWQRRSGSGWQLALVVAIAGGILYTAIDWVLSLLR